MPGKVQNTAAPVAVKASLGGHAKWEVGKKDVPLFLLVPPQRPFRGLHNDVVQALKPILSTGWSGAFNMSVLEDKAGGPNYEVIDGNHRLTALKEMWHSGEIDGNYLVGVAIFKKETPDAVLMERADSVNTSNETFQHMTLVDKLFFLRQVLVRMDDARLATTKKTLPGNLLFQLGTVWELSPAKIHEYLYNNKQDSHTQKMVGLFRSFFGPADYYKGNVDKPALNRVATVWNQLHWLNERSATWWAHLRNTMASAVISINARAASSDWKRVGIPAIVLDMELKLINTQQATALHSLIEGFKSVLKVTGLLVLNSVYPGVFMNDQYGQKSTAEYRPKFEYIALRGFVHFAVTGKLATREQFLSYKDEVASEEVYSRFRLWEALEATRRAYDNTMAGALWCTAWSAPLPKAILRCAWPACRGLLEDLESKNLQACAVCLTYFACLDCTTSAFSSNVPKFQAGGNFVETQFCVCPTCYIHLSVRGGDNPTRCLWPYPASVQDSPGDTAECVRCWVGLGQCNVHAVHRGNPHFKYNGEKIAKEDLPSATRKFIESVPGRGIMCLIAQRLGDMTAHSDQLEANRILHEVQLATLLPSRDVAGLWRAACHNSLTKIDDIKMADLDKAGVLSQAEPDLGVVASDIDEEQLANNAEQENKKMRREEQKRKMDLYKQSLHRGNTPKQLMVPLQWQSYHARRNQPDYKNNFDLMIFDPMYGKAEQPTQDDFAKIRDMLQAMTKSDAIALVFNNPMNFDLWTKALEQTPPDKDTAPWHCDPWPFIILRALQRNRTPRTADYLKNRAEMALVFRKAVRAEAGKKGRWMRASGNSLLDQFARHVPEIIPPNTNVWENYVPPGAQEALHDEDGKRVRPLAEKSRALCEKILFRFCPYGEGGAPSGKVFDFYAGTGVFAIAAKTLSMHYVGSEQDTKVCALAQMRLGAVQQVLDSEELRNACGKAQPTLMTTLVPSAGMDAMMNYVSRTQEGCLPTVMEPRKNSRNYYRFGVRPDGKGAVHGDNCDCVVAQNDDNIFTELSKRCQDFYTQPSKLTGINGEKLGDGVFAARHFDRGENLELFAFGTLTSKVAYEANVQKPKQYPPFPGVFALERSGWLLVLDEACPAAKINSHQETTSKQNVIFHERKDDKSKLVAKNEAFKYLQVCTIESIEQDEELLATYGNAFWAPEVRDDFPGPRAPMNLIEQDPEEEIEEVSNDDAEEAENKSAECTRRNKPKIKIVDETEPQKGREVPAIDLTSPTEDEEKKQRKKAKKDKRKTQVEPAAPEENQQKAEAANQEAAVEQGKKKRNKTKDKSVEGGNASEASSQRPVRAAAAKGVQRRQDSEESDADLMAEADADEFEDNSENERLSDKVKRKKGNK